MIFFRNETKKNKQNRKKRKPNRLGSDFLKEIVHERINQNLQNEKLKQTHTYTLKRMQRENKRTGEILSKNNKQKKKENMKQQKN